MAIVRSESGPSREGTTVYFENEEGHGGLGWDSEEHRARPRDKVVESARDVLADAVQLTRSCAVAFREALDDPALGRLSPDTVTLELTIGLDSEVGAVLAKASAKAEFRVTLEWEPAKASPTKIQVDKVGDSNGGLHE
jgi:hypothetical protein